MTENSLVAAFRAGKLSVTHARAIARILEMHEPGEPVDLVDLHNHLAAIDPEYDAVVRRIILNDVAMNALRKKARKMSREFRERVASVVENFPPSFWAGGKEAPLDFRAEEREAAPVSSAFFAVCLAEAGLQFGNLLPRLQEKGVLSKRFGDYQLVRGMAQRLREFLDHGIVKAALSQRKA